MSYPFILFLTGASGVGKTTLVECMEKRFSQPYLHFFHCDSEGVPLEDEMIEQFGSGSAWQEMNTRYWIRRALKSYSKNDVVVIEGQSRVSFIKTAFHEYGVVNSQVVLIDCKKEIVEKRLIEERKNPNLANVEMWNWMNFLRKEAYDENVSIIDTTNKKIDEVATEIVTKYVPTQFFK